MKSLLLCCLVAAALALIGTPAAAWEPPQDAGAVRALLQTAAAGATGSQSASASASASNIGGQQSAQTSSSATGQGAATFGLSEAAGEVDRCLNVANSGTSECRTLAPRIRSSRCTDFAPDTNFTCAQQASFNKCGADFIFKGAYCLKSCNRCGGSCTDTAPADGSGCDASKCDSDAYTAGPVCLKTCGRCSTTADTA